eukprot:5685478-Prymnesium_polylepis.1
MQQQQLLDERAALSTFASPFLAELLGTHKTAVALFLVLELCDGPELYAVLKEQGKFGKDVVPLYAACVACALAELHSRKWMYRDLKAENVVFVSSGAVKLVDMGLAIRTPDGTEHFTQCGSTEYMAPEVVEQSGYGCGADWWSFGCLVYEMAFGCTPWVVDYDGSPNYALSDTEVSKRIVDAERQLIYPADLARPPPSELCSVLERLLERTAPTRLGCGNGGVEGIQAHPFFANVDWEGLVKGTVVFPPMPEVVGGGDDEGGDEGGGAEEEEPAAVDPVSAQLM